MHRIRSSVVLAALAAALMAGTTVPAGAVVTGKATQIVAGTSTQIVAANPSNPTGVAEAAAAHASATTLRRTVGRLLSRYLADYGDRLSTAEQARMRFLVKDADRQLGIVETRTATTERLARNGSPRAAVYRSAKAAEFAFTSAKASSVTTLAEVQPMLQSKLGLFEALSAKGDLDEQLARYDSLGVQIRKVSTAYAP